MKYRFTIVEPCVKLFSRFLYHARHWNHTSAIQRGNIVLTHSASWPDSFCHLQALQINSMQILFRITHIHKLLLALLWAVLPQLTKFRGPRMHSPTLYHDGSEELLLLLSQLPLLISNPILTTNICI